MCKFGLFILGGSGKISFPRVIPREWVRSPKFESRRVKLLRDGCARVARVKLGMRNVHRVHVTDIWSWYRVELRVGDHLGRSEELVSRCVECDLAEPESLASLGGSAPGVVDGILSEAFTFDDSTLEHITDTYSPSYSINKTHIYHVSKHSSSHYGAPIDRGANGGLAGSDVRILERTGRTVSVTGIDNHELPGLDIVTCAPLLHTNHGKVVLIMHEYAYYGRGNTIHSPGQIEWFQNTCDDKSFHVGGKQVINFLDGYSTPLQCRTGLMYMSLLGQPTDADLNTYPHVLLTGPHEWTLLFGTSPTLPPLVTPPGPQTLPYSVPMTPGLMNLAILRGEFSIPSSPTLLNINMLSPLNPLTLRGSGPILAGSTNTPLRRPLTKPLNGLLLPLGTP